jgi:hypothetical protein
MRSGQIIQKEKENALQMPYTPYIADHATARALVLQGFAGVDGLNGFKMD